MAPISVPRQGTNGIPCEAHGFVYIRFEVRVIGYYEGSLFNETNDK
jgi:hypothetical protein